MKMKKETPASKKSKKGLTIPKELAKKLSAACEKQTWKRQVFFLCDKKSLAYLASLRFRFLEKFIIYNSKFSIPC